MQAAKMTETTAYPSKSGRVNLYRNARVTGEITLTSNPSSLFASSETLRQKFSVDFAERETLLVDILVKAGIISNADAAAALLGSPEYTAVDYLRIFCHKSQDDCDAFNSLREKVWSGRITLNQAAVAANYIYTTGSTSAEAVSLVKWAGG